MRIGITGDTHGSKEAIVKIVQYMLPVDLWLHTGDYSQDAELLQKLTEVPVIRDNGNCE